MIDKVKEILLLLLISISFGSSIMAQEEQQNNKAKYAISGYYPIFYRNCCSSHKEISLYQLSFEKNWSSEKYSLLNYSLNFRFGRVFTVNNFTPKNIYKEPLYGIDFSTLIGTGNNFLELGAGTDDNGLFYAIVGYRLLLGDHFLVKFHLLPSTWYVIESMNSTDSYTHFLDFGVGVGYQFGKKNSGKITSFFNRFSFESMLYTISYEKNSELRPSVIFGLDFLLYHYDRHSLSLTGGAGFIAEGPPFFQVGIRHLYGEKSHYFDEGLNITFANLQDAKRQHNDYKLIQVHLGYRYECQKLPLFARVAYAPYIRTLDWKREGGLKHNMVFGVGYRFQKRKS
jgi:hypothetical protein